MKNIKYLILVFVATLVFIPAMLGQESKLDEGEILYRGITKLEKCDEAIFSFVLTANKDTVKNFSLELNGIYIQESSGRLTKVNSKSSFDAKAVVKNGSLDFTQYFGYFRITIKEGLGADIMVGELNCIYEVNINQREDLGTAPIEFKKVGTGYSQVAATKTESTKMMLTVKEIFVNQNFLNNSVSYNSLLLTDENGVEVSVTDLNEWFENVNVKRVIFPGSIQVEYVIDNSGTGSGGKLADDSKMQCDFEIGGKIYTHSISKGSEFLTEKTATGKYILLTEESITLSPPPITVEQATNNQSAQVDLALNKAYSFQDFEFTIQTVKIHEGSYPMGMFSGRPSNPNMDPSFDGVLGIELTLNKGNDDTFSELEKYLVNEKGERNVKEDRVILSNAPKFTVLFNVPMSSRKIKFGIGNLELNLEKVLNEPQIISNNAITSESQPTPALPAGNNQQPAMPPAENRQPVEIQLSSDIGAISPNTVAYENKNYTVSMGTITNDGQGTVVVEILTEEIIEIPLKNGAAVAPIMMKIETNGKTIVANDKVSILDNSMSFNFGEIPDKVIVYGNDGKLNTPTVTFDITDDMVKNYKSFAVEIHNTPEMPNATERDRSNNITASGMATSNIAWRVENKTLFVSGQGDIPGNPSWISAFKEFNAVVIGDGITSIGHHAFAMSKIESIVIGKDMKSINTYALFNCNDLTTVEIKNPIPPNVGSFVFMLTSIGKAKLIVPAGTKAAYLKNNSWKKFGIIEER